jgi:hypothetical protein
MGTSIERGEILLEWRAALLELAEHCERLGLAIRIDSYLELGAFK